ncbi:uncharacterized protein LOC110449041 [Mizuhopecten yessoensis]|uniref:uncharacterized protein LOC110449041 n=1 Tax=Mizuhopecten yessoensis TaxID=6573 RepID=UPI000B45EA20|nr:uncharacterized protein LOC110449041 [Mizuhopecten yessoensis]
MTAGTISLHRCLYQVSMTPSGQLSCRGALGRCPLKASQMKRNKTVWFLFISIALFICRPSDGQFLGGGSGGFNTFPGTRGQTPAFQVNSALVNNYDGGTANQVGQRRYQELVKYTPYYVDEERTPGLSIATLLLLGLLYGIISMTSANQSDMTVTMLSVGMGAYLGYGFGGGRGRRRGRGGGRGGGGGGGGGGEFTHSKRNDKPDLSTRNKLRSMPILQQLKYRKTSELS